MSILENIRYLLSNPIVAAREINRLYHQRLFFKDFNTSGVDVFDEDWDNLLILDSCRYDIFSEMNTLPGKLSKKQSRGTGTKEFLHGNFKNRDLRDTVYITANPQLYYNEDEINAKLHDVLNIWQDIGWDEKVGTVRPETLTEYALEYSEQYNNKRLVVHYMQPHRPFLGPTAEKHSDLGSLFGAEDAAKPNVPQDVYWQAFEENLELTLPHVQEIMEELDGKTVVTADHGQVIGEHLSPLPVRDYGHWSGNYIDELVSVPWLEYESGPRRRIIAEDPETETDDVDQEIVESRLRQLGYAE
ncbi:hypothetical protein [Halorientalis litorea]|uniref:hypothetical protein n=1 Tax=Halorientalis litorea TaxID=2931977 RepID=UPI001FF6EEE1|nr:hypothetical protein [Halorientalis litorea]